MNHRYLQKFIFVFLMVFSTVLFSISNAQQMFFHLLPGFGTPFTWIGLGGDANWNTPANWNTGIVPGGSDTATFDDTCLSNCDPIINVAINIRGVNIKGNYAGAITQAAGQTITIGSVGWTQEGGTFNGADANITVVKFAISAGVFNAPTAQFLVSASAATAADNSTLFSVTGTATTNFATTDLKFYAACSYLNCVNYGIDVGTAMTVSTVFFDFSDTSNQDYGFSWTFSPTNILTVTNTMTMQRTSSGGVSVRGGRINLNGNLNALTGARGGSTHVYFQSGAAQTLSGVTGSTAPIIHVDKPAGAVTVPTLDAGCEALLIANGDFTAPTGLLTIRNQSTIANAGTIFSTSATGNFIHNSGTVSLYTSTQYLGITAHTIDVNSSVTFNNLNFKFFDSTFYYITYTIGAGDTINVLGNLSLGRLYSVETVTYNGGTINVSGNYDIGAGTNGGTTVVNVIGGVNKTITYAAGAVAPGTVTTINKPAATLTQTNAVSFTAAGHDLNISNGVYNMAGFNLVVNDEITIGASGKLLCNGGSVTASNWIVNGEVSCGSSIGITWTGLAGDHLWSTAGNWTNNTVPGASDIAIFNGMCTGVNCDAQINSNLSVRGLILKSDYSGVLTQNATRTLTVGTVGFTQAGGTFMGGNAAIAMNGPFNLSAGSFTATSGAWTQSADLSIAGAATFNHNNGSWISTTSILISANGKSFNNVYLGGSAVVSNLNSQTLIVEGLLEMADTFSSGSGSINSGTIEARGNIVTSQTGKKGTAIIRINGTGAQNFTATAGVTPSIEINKISGTLTLVGPITTSKNWSHLSGTVDASASSIIFSASNAVQQIIPGTMIYNDVQFAGYATTQELNSGTMVISGQLTILDTYTSGNLINNGTIEAQGNITISNNGKNGSGLVVVNGTGAQTINGAGGSVPAIQINKPSGLLTMAGTITTYSNFTWIAGTVDSASSTIVFGGNQTITPGPVVYNNVYFGGYAATQNLNGGTIIVAGQLTFGDTYYSNNAVNNGTIEAQGNITTTSNGKSGTVLVRINGTGAQLFTGSGGTIPAVEINKASGTLTLSGSLSTAYDYAWVSGTIDAGSSSLVFLGNQNITPGPAIYYNVYFGGYSKTQNLGGNTIIASGTVTFGDTYYSLNNVNNGTIEARGSVTTASNGKIGTAILNFTGAGTGTLSLPAGSLLSTTLNILKTGGASVQLGGNVSFAAGRNFSITSGSLDLNGFDFNVGNTLNISVGATLKCNGGEFTAGTLSNLGTVNCPGFSTYDFNWTGAGGDTNWTTAGNWQGGVAPGVSDVAAFQDSTCGGFCNATINSNVSVKGVRLFSPYTGVITQASGQAVTLGSRSWVQNAGTFVGSDSDFTINLAPVGGKFNLAGGTFTSPSGNFKITRANHQFASMNEIVFEIGASGTFNHNNGTVILNCNETWNGNSKYGMDVNSTLNLYNLIMKADGGYGNGHYIATGDTVTVLNDFTIQSGLYLPSGTIHLHRNLNDGSTNYGSGGNYSRGIVTMKGTGAQTYGYTGNTPGVKITVDKPSGSLTAATANAWISNLVVTNGTFTAPTGNLTIGHGGYVEYGNKTLMTLATPAQFVDSGGTVIFYGYDDWNASYQYTYNFNGALTLTNVNFLGYGNSTNIIAGGSTLIATGTLTHASGILQGAIQPQGNVAFNSSVLGSATMTFTGSAVQTISGNFPTTGHWILNKPGGSVDLATAFNLNGVGQNLTITAGTLNMSGHNLNVGNNISNSGTLQRGTSPTCGAITQGGSYSGTAAICP